MTPRPLSNQESKLLTSLEHKKYRDSLGLFRAEGSKVIEPLLQFFTPELVILPEGGTGLSTPIPPEVLRVASPIQYRKLSLLDSPGDSIAVLRKPQPLSIDTTPPSGLMVALDALQNPGNLGTIIRLCDWLGIEILLLGEGCVDPFNPKVVQSTAGALGALRIYEHIDLEQTLRTLRCPIIGTALDGEDVSRLERPSGSTVILFGNEGHGMGDALKASCSKLIRIPSAPSTVSESLNVSISAAIILSQITLS